MIERWIISVFQNRYKDKSTRMCLRKGMENVFSRNSLTVMHRKVWKILVCNCRSRVCLHLMQKRKDPFSLKNEVSCILLLASLLLFLLTDMANFFCMCSRVEYNNMFIMCAGNSWLAGVWFQRLFIVQLCSSSGRGWIVGSSCVSCGCVCSHTACERTSHIMQIVTLLNCMLPQ